MNGCIVIISLSSRVQEKFDMMKKIEGGRARLKDRRLFLFKHVLVLSKKRKRDDSDQENYFVKETLKVSIYIMTAPHE